MSCKRWSRKNATLHLTPSLNLGAQSQISKRSIPLANIKPLNLTSYHLHYLKISISISTPNFNLNLNLNLCIIKNPNIKSHSQSQINLKPKILNIKTRISKSHRRRAVHLRAAAGPGDGRVTLWPPVAWQEKHAPVSGEGGGAGMRGRKSE